MDFLSIFRNHPLVVNILRLALKGKSFLRNTVVNLHQRNTMMVTKAPNGVLGSSHRHTVSHRCDLLGGKLFVGGQHSLEIIQASHIQIVVTPITVHGDSTNHSRLRRIIVGSILQILNVVVVAKHSRSTLIGAVGGDILLVLGICHNELLNTTVTDGNPLSVFNIVGIHYDTTIVNSQILSQVLTVSQGRYIYSVKETSIIFKIRIFSLNVMFGFIFIGKGKTGIRLISKSRPVITYVASTQIYMGIAFLRLGYSGATHSATGVDPFFAGRSIS